MLLPTPPEPYVKVPDYHLLHWALLGRVGTKPNRDLFWGVAPAPGKMENATGLRSPALLLLSAVYTATFAVSSKACRLCRVNGPLRVRRRGKYRMLVLPQDLQPVPQIGGIIFAGFCRDPKRHTQEGTPEFGNQFLGGADVVSEALPERACGQRAA